MRASAAVEPSRGAPTGTISAAPRARFCASSAAAAGPILRAQQRRARARVSALLLLLLRSKITKISQLALLVPRALLMRVRASASAAAAMSRAK